MNARNRRGKNLVDIATELQAIQDTAMDYTVPTAKMKAYNENGKVELGFNGGAGTELFGLNNYTSGQVASYTDIPTKYFRKLQDENPNLLCDNINHGFDRIVHLNKGKRPEKRLVRTVHKNGAPIIRGFVSGSYRRLDSYDLVNYLVPIFQKHDLQVVEANLDEKKFYVKAVSNRLTTEVKRGDLVRWGVMFQNSDVGAGSLAHSLFVDRCFCDNGMVMPDVRRKYHVGRQTHEDALSAALSERTLSLQDKAFFSALTDTVEASLAPENFEAHVNRMREAAMLPIKTLDPGEVVVNAMRLTGVTGESKQQSIVAALASGNEGAGLTKWGLINSFTRAAKNEEWAYEESVQLEQAAGQILEMPNTEWEKIAS